MRVTGALLAAAVLLVACATGQCAPAKATMRETDVASASPHSRRATILNRVGLPRDRENRLEWHNDKTPKRAAPIPPKVQVLKRGKIEETYDKFDYPRNRASAGRR